MKAARDTVVTMHYTLTDDSGEVLDTSSGREPLAYLHGHGNIIPGLEAALENATAGHSASVTVDADQGYGEINKDLIFEAKREHLPDDLNLVPGERVYADTPNGPIGFTIMSVTDTGAMLDGNHPLAGKRLHFEVEIIEVRAATAEELTHGHVHGPGGHHH